MAAIRLALGTYRMGGAPGHLVALSHAMLKAGALGAPLRIDTAPTYESGASERMVGAALGSVDGDGACHVTTKVGVVDAHDAEWFRSGKADDGAEYRDVSELAVGAGWHCLDPAFLRASLERSTARLGRAPNVLLLHNPELHLTAELARFAPPSLVTGGENPGGAGSDDALLSFMTDNAAAWDEVRARFIARLERAFGGLEELVREGRIEGYGVSSNVRGCRLSASGRTAPLSAFEAVTLDELLNAARRAAGEGATTSGFCDVQVPLNVCEAGALLDDGAASEGDGASAIAIAARRGIDVTLNRVLHAIPPRGVGYGDWGRSSTFLNLRDAVPIMPAPALFRTVLREAILTCEPELVEEGALWRMSLQTLALWTAASAPGVATCLVGARTEAYVDEMIAVAALPRLQPETVLTAFRNAEDALRELTPRS